MSQHQQKHHQQEEEETASSNEESAHVDVTTVEEEERSLEYELALVRKVRLAMTASLHMLETARDDLEEMGNRMDRLQVSSQVCRQAFLNSQSEKK
jgi:hypothetical protein